MSRTARHSTGVLAILIFCLVGTGCDQRDTPVAPASNPPPAPGPTDRPIPFRVISGGDQTPVAGVAVLIDGVPYVTDAAGYITLGAPGPLSGATVDIDAPGFLQRRTSVRVFGETFVLWPVADQAEANAVRDIGVQVRAERNFESAGTDRVHRDNTQHDPGADGSITVGE